MFSSESIIKIHQITGDAMNTMLNGIKIFLLALIAIISLACSVDDKDSRMQKATSPAVGHVAIGLTDAAGDFIHYAVDISSLRLVKANGTVVETLPETSRIDFTDYTDMTEFLTVASVPPGAYTELTMTLDYSQADIQVEDDSGQAVSVSQLVDVDGNPLTTLDINLQLQGRNKLVVAPGLLKHMTLDFDLKASNSVSFDAQGQATVVVQPVLLADLQLTSPKAHRLRGALGEVDVSANVFSLYVHPFYRKIKRHKRFGIMQVSVSDETIFEIDGVRYAGPEGINLLATLSEFSRIVVLGDLQPKRHTFIAREVYAGNSVAGGSLDMVAGSIVKREGSVLTVNGASLHRADGSMVFGNSFSVTLSDQTVVFKQGSSAAMASDALSVGQRIRAFGLLDASLSTSLDASSGRVRMLPTSIRGTRQDAVGASTDLVMKLDMISGRQAGLYDFSGTGSVAANDADPAAYEITTGSLPLTDIGTGDALGVRGFVTPFGSAPADFDAQSVIDLSAVPYVIHVNWKSDALSRLSELSDSGFSVTVKDVMRFHHVYHAGLATDVEGLTITLTTEAEGGYWLYENKKLRRYNAFSELVSTLQMILDQGGKVSHLSAIGGYNAETFSFTSDSVVIRVTSGG